MNTTTTALTTRSYSQDARLSSAVLSRQNRRFQATGGISSGNHSAGFVPAFQNRENGAIYLSRFADGSPAPLHLLDGLPAEAVARRDAGGRVVAALTVVVAGFLLAGRFYTREQAAAYCING